jgi:DNA polymerase-4
VIAEPHYDAYADFSRRANAIYARYTDMIEPFGIDESWLDVTSSRKLFGTGYEIAEQISRDIKNELGITISVGVSFNKVFAKLGSDYKKPDAITVIDRSNMEQIVYPLPVSTLLYVGARTAATLTSMGIRTIGDLARFSPDILVRKLGKAGEMLHKYAAGLDDRPVESHSNDDAKSISNGYTFRHDLLGYEESRVGISYLSDEIGTKLRARGLKCCTVQITVKDEYLRSIQRQRQQIPPTDISDEIAKTAFAILKDEWSPGKPIRMLTVTAANLIKDESYAPQISLFDAAVDEFREKRKKKENAVDKIRQKYGNNSIIKGAIIDTDLGIYHAPEADIDKNKK